MAIRRRRTAPDLSVDSYDSTTPGPTEAPPKETQVSDSTDTDFVPNADEAQPVVPADDWYDACIVGCTALRAEKDQKPITKEGDNIINWRFRLDDGRLVETGGNTVTLFHRNNVEPHKDIFAPHFGDICDAVGLPRNGLTREMREGVSEENPLPCRIQTKQAMTDAGVRLNVRGISAR